MGSPQSKNNNEEEALSRFKHRIQFIELAIFNRNAFSAAFTAYALCLKNTGAALTDGTFPVDFLPPQPPPFSDPNNQPPPPVRRSQPQLNDEAAAGGTSTHFGTEDLVGGKVQNMAGLPIPVRRMVKKLSAEIGRKTRQPLSLKQIFLDIDHHFLKAFESSFKVSVLLEAKRLHSRPNFAGDIDHLISSDDDVDMEEFEIPATAVLDKMLDWENKLYDKLNAGEVIKYEYQKTVSLLNKQKKHSNPKSLVKSYTTISHLHTRYIVEIQSASSTIAMINCARDEQLYPRLVELVDGMATMWKTMLFHHESQAKIVYYWKSLDNSQLQYHYDCTFQLCQTVRDWYTQFCGLIEYQKDFVSALHSWSKLSITIPIESNLEEKFFSPPMVPNARIHALLIAWKNDLDKLPDEFAKNAIRNFAVVTQTIVHQQEDLKMRGRCKATQKELHCKSTQCQDSCEKNGGNEELNPNSPLKYANEDMKQKLEGDEEACQKVCKAAKLKSLASLRHSLIEVFSAMSEISQTCTGMYCNLKRIVEEEDRISFHI